MGTTARAAPRRGAGTGRGVRRLPRRAGPAGWEQKLPSWPAGEQIATRAACADALNAIAGLVPGLIGGGADLTGNTGTKLSGFGVFSPEDRKGRQLYFGVREHGMGSVDERDGAPRRRPPVRRHVPRSSPTTCGPSVRLAALEQARTAFVWSHDSVGLGEDGPTHQPIEHLASLRAIPGLRVIRPADANETSQAWRVHLNSDGPSAFILSRQKLPVLEGTAERAEAGVARGAYVLVDETGDLELVLIGTGSEVSVCVDAQKALAESGISARVVSMPCWELFELLSEDEQAAVLPPDVPTLAVEAAATMGWERFADDAIGLDRFGASAPGATALENLGFTPQCVVDRALALLATGGHRRATPPGASAEPPLRGESSHDIAPSPASTTTARAPGTTTSAGRCWRAASWPG